MSDRIRLALSLLVALLLSVVEVAFTQQPPPLLFTQLPPEGTPVSTADPNGHLGAPTTASPSTVMVAALGEICQLSDDGTPANPLLPYGPQYRGPINFALGTFSDGGVNEVVLLTTPGGPSNLPVRLFSSPGPNPVLVGDVDFPPSTSPGGRLIAMANLIGDAAQETIIGRLRGPGSIDAVEPSGRIFLSFTPFGETPDDEVRISLGDIVGHDGRDELIATRAHGGEVKVFEIVHGDTPLEIGHGFPFAIPPSGGVWTAAADVNGDGVADVVTGTGSGAPHIRIFNLAGPAPTVLGDFLPFPSSTNNGVRVAAGVLGGQRVVIGTSGPDIRVFNASPSGNWAFWVFRNRPFGDTLSGGMDVQMFTPSTGTTR